jgi:hypothetical protein
VLEKTSEAVKRDRHLLFIPDHILKVMMEEIDDNLERVGEG